MNKELKLVIFLSYIYIGMTLLSSLLATPLIVRGLGQEQYGLYTVVFTTVAYLAVTEFGIGNIVVRNVKKYILKEDKQGLSNFLFAALIVYCLFALFILSVSAIISLNAPLIFSRTFSDTLVHQFRFMFHVMTANTFMLFFHNFFFAIITGHERFIFARCLLLCKIVIRVVGIVVLMLRGFGAQWIFVMDLTLTVICTLIFAAYSFFKLGVKIKFYYFDRKIFKSLLQKSSFLYSSMVIENVFWNIGNLLTAAFWGAAEVGIFGIATTFCLIFIQLAGAASEYCLAFLTGVAVSDKTGKQMNDIFISFSKYLSVLLVLIVLVFLFAGRDFIILWAGAPYARAYTIAAILLCALLYPKMQVLGEVILQAKNKFGARFAMYASVYIPCTVISCFIIAGKGVSFSWVGITLAIVAFNIICLNIYYRKVGVDAGRFFREVFLPILPAVILPAAAGLTLSFVFPQTSAAIFLTKISVVSLSYLAGIWFFYFKKEEKAHVLKTVLKR